MPTPGAAPAPIASVDKLPTGIPGFDQITQGGLPRGRITAVLGGPGAGKTMFALQTLVNRWKRFGDAGIFATFEETTARVRANVAAFDWQFARVPADRLILVDAQLSPDVVQSGKFDLTALLARLSSLKAQSGAVNIVFDGIDNLLSMLDDRKLERAELTRIDDWVRKEQVSAIVTAKNYTIGNNEQDRADLIQYLCDCAVLLEARLFAETLSRSIRIVKYRGSGFNANATPLILDHSGINVIALGTARQDYPVFEEKISTGIPRLDTAIGGGIRRGSSVLISGAPGTAKTSISCSVIAATCRRGHKAAYVSFDESAPHVVQNLKSVGIDLEPCLTQGLLRMMSVRTSGSSPEEVLVKVLELLDDHAPTVIAIDPISAFTNSSHPFVHAISETLLDAAKSRGISLVATSLLTSATGQLEDTSSFISTIADSWLHLSYVIQNGERCRALTIIKSRGTAHSSQVRELVLSSDGIDLLDVYTEEGEVLFGSARFERQRQRAWQEQSEEIAFRRKKEDLLREVSELRIHANLAQEQLEGKLREAGLEEWAESVRLKTRGAELQEREIMRRKSDDESAPPNGRARSEGIR